MPSTAHPFMLRMFQDMHFLENMATKVKSMTLSGVFTKTQLQHWKETGCVGAALGDDMPPS